MNPRTEFAKLIHDPTLTVMPGAYDGFSARMIESLGFPALTAGGYVANGSMYAEADIGQSNMREFADHYARICGAVDIPVTVDADTGFGGVHNVRRMVRAFEDAGVASLTIGDQTFPNRCGYMAGKDVVPVDEMVAKIRAAVDARRDPAMLIAARTDCASILGVDAAIERANIYLEAGADLAKPMGIHDSEDVRRVVREVPSPYFAVMSQAAGAHAVTFEELRSYGASVVILPSIALFAAAFGIKAALLRIKADQSLHGAQTELLPLEEYYELVGLAEASQREDRYRREADEILNGRAFPEYQRRS